MILVALDDGVVDTTYHVETGGGIWPMYGREMKDHNWRKGGYFDWNSIKASLRDEISHLMYERTKRSPMILPVIMEV